MLDSAVREGREDSLAAVVPPMAEVGRVASDNASDSEDGSRCHSGHSRGHAPGGDCAASGSELSTCIFSTPKIAAEAEEAREDSVGVPALALESPRLGGSSDGRDPPSNDRVGPANDCAKAASPSPPEGRRRSSQGCLCLRDLRSLVQRQAQGPATVDANSSTCSSGELVSVESLQAVQQLLALSEAQLAEERRALAESRAQVALESEVARTGGEARRSAAEAAVTGAEAMQQLREELVEARKDLELRGQQATSADDEIAQLRADLAAAQSDLENQREQAVALVDARACESALRTELIAAQRSEKAEAVQASLAEASKEQTKAQWEVLRGQYQKAEAELLRAKADLAERADQQSCFEEELRVLRSQQLLANTNKATLQGGNSMLTRHELACRSTEKKATKPSSTSRAHGYWLSCCSSVEVAQPAKAQMGSSST